MPLDPQTVSFGAMAKANLSYEAMTPQEARCQIFDMFHGTASGGLGGKIANSGAQGRSGSHYRPSAAAVLPVVVFFTAAAGHGQHRNERVLPATGQRVGWAVVSVDYRLAPK
jgi:acetyl esterase/lipase